MDKRLEIIDYYEMNDKEINKSINVSEQVVDNLFHDMKKINVKYMVDKNLEKEKENNPRSSSSILRNTSFIEIKRDSKLNKPTKSSMNKSISSVNINKVTIPKSPLTKSYVPKK